LADRTQPAPWQHLRCALAYDPSTGLTSISVGEAGAAARFETHLYLNPAKTPLYAGGGGVRSDGGQGRPWSLTLHTFSVSNRMQRAGPPRALPGPRLTVRDSGDPARPRRSPAGTTPPPFGCSSIRSPLRFRGCCASSPPPCRLTTTGRSAR